jgi:hypothetical protein
MAVNARTAAARMNQTGPICIQHPLTRDRILLSDVPNIENVLEHMDEPECEHFRQEARTARESYDSRTERREHQDAYLRL